MKTRHQRVESWSTWTNHLLSECSRAVRRKPQVFGVGQNGNSGTRTCLLPALAIPVASVSYPHALLGQMGSFLLEILLVEGSQLAGRPTAANCLCMTSFWINVSLHSCLCPRVCWGSADSSACPSPSTEVMGCNYVISQERKEKTPCAW